MAFVDAVEDYQDSLKVHLNAVKFIYKKYITKIYKNIKINIYNIININILILVSIYLKNISRSIAQRFAVPVFCIFDLREVFALKSLC